MCGICGQINLDHQRPVDRQGLERMNSVIRHRGPDSDGYYLNGTVGLAMRRLAIIDLVSGDQPLSNEDNTIWIVFNGEIYNSPDLRPKLERQGHTFRTNTDTETIVHLYEDHGSDCVNYLRGMFAFAIWDENRQQLLLARDRAGQKPLYYAEYNGAFLFGSELKTILHYPGFPRHIDLEAIHHYLSLQYVPDPWTAFRDIRKLPPAHRLVWRDGQYTIDRYWDLPYDPKWSLSEAELRQRVRDTVTEAVRIRLVSDVPLGAHLSGGIDSSIVVGVMASLMGQPVKTFSIGFEEGGFNELAYARQVAQRFGTDHHEFIIHPDALEVLPELVRHFDEPFADSAALPTWFLAQMTRQHVTVALNGDGGDEAFGGYQRYYADPFADAYRLVPEFLRQRVAAPLFQALPVPTSVPLERNYAMALRRLGQAASLSSAASIVRWGSFFSEDEKWALYNADTRRALVCSPSVDLLEEAFSRAQATTRLDRTLSTDVNNYLPGALLPKVDRTTMAHALEARSPFLDHQVLELTARLPTTHKVKGLRTKCILRDAFDDVLPPAIGRRGKMGFGQPLGAWFRGPLYETSRSLLLSPDARNGCLLSPGAVADVLDTHRRGREDYGKRIWALLCLELWLREYGAT